jgi:hypothetical protein
MKNSAPRMLLAYISISMLPVAAYGQQTAKDPVNQETNSVIALVGSGSMRRIRIRRASAAERAHCPKTACRSVFRACRGPRVLSSVRRRPGCVGGS